MATMRDVAKRAGVSVATVSGVLNGSRYVSAELKERVLRAIRELDYTINSVARSLQSRSTRMIGMLVPDISDLFHAGVVRVVEDVLKTAGYSLMLGSLHDRPEEQSRYLQLLRTNQVDGVLLYMVPGCEEEVRKLLDSRRPVVLMGRAPLTFVADLVAIDHSTASRMAVEHLISRGHQRIGIVPGPEHQPYARARIEGWNLALRKAGLSTADDYVCYGEYTIEGGERAASQLLDCAAPPTAILAGNFHVMIGVLRVLRQRRIRRPEEVEVMASHDSPVLDAFDPPISSIDQPVRELGLKATELLLQRIRQPGRPPEVALLRPGLKIRTAGVLTPPTAISR
jgi:LacI family transcriptional regulator, galactose operon repressor